MRLSLQKTLLRSLFFTLIVLLIVYFVTLLFFIKPPFDPAANSWKTVHLWWFIDKPYRYDAFIWSFTGPGVLLLFSLAASSILSYYFKNSSSTEIFFFRLFLLIIPFHSLFLLNTFLIEGYLPPQWGFILGRMNIFIRIFAFGSLFTSSFLSFGLNLQKIKYLLISIFLTSFLIALNFPVRAAELSYGTVYVPASEELLFLICGILEFLTLLNFLLAVITKNRENYLLIFFSVLMTIIGYEFLFYSVFPFFLIGLGFLTAGTYFFSRRIYYIYRWQ